MLKLIIMSALLLPSLRPSLVAAQRGMTPPGVGRRGGGMSRDPGLVVARQLNAVNLLVEHRQELVLTDAQFAGVVAIKRSLDSANAPLHRRLDSLQHLFRGGAIVFGAPSAEHRDSLARARAVVAETLAGTADNLALSRDQAFALLSATQLPRARALEDAAAKTLADDATRGRRGG